MYVIVDKMETTINELTFKLIYHLLLEQLRKIDEGASSDKGMRQQQY